MKQGRRTLLKAFFPAFFAGALLLASCGGQADVYVAGYEVNIDGITAACYWKNGERTALTTGNTGAQANAIVLAMMAAIV